MTIRDHNGFHFDFWHGEISSTMSEEIDRMFEYAPWDEDQIARGAEVREALANAVKVIIKNVPPGEDRKSAIRKIREARMDANSAITHKGEF